MSPIESAEIESPVIDSDEAATELPDPDSSAEDAGHADPKPSRAARFVRAALSRHVLLPVLVLLIALGVAYLKYEVSAARAADAAAAEAVTTASDGVAAMLSYRFDTAEKDLAAATDRMTGSLREDYLKLTKDVVIPGAKQKRISSQAMIPAAAPLSASADHAEVLLYVNQTVTFGDDPPNTTSSSVRVTLDRVGGRWLLSSFEPL